MKKDKNTFVCSKSEIIPLGSTLEFEPGEVKTLTFLPLPCTNIHCTFRNEAEETCNFYNCCAGRRE